MIAAGIGYRAWRNRPSRLCPIRPCRRRGQKSLYSLVFASPPVKIPLALFGTTLFKALSHSEARVCRCGSRAPQASARSTGSLCPYVSFLRTQRRSRAVAGGRHGRPGRARACLGVRVNAHLFEKERERAHGSQRGTCKK